MLEREILDAIGLKSPQLHPEPKPKSLELNEANVTIYDFGKALAENEPTKRKKK